MRFRLVPENRGGKIVLQRQITAPAPPSQRLYRYPQALLEPYRVGYMPAVEAKTLGDIIMPVAPDHLGQPGIGTAKFSVLRSVLVATRSFALGVEIIGTTEIIFR